MVRTGRRWVKGNIPLVWWNSGKAKFLLKFFPVQGVNWPEYVMENGDE